MKEESYLLPDNGDVCWQIGSETFTRKEVADMLHTQRAMISNDLKTYCGNDLTEEMFVILDKPRMPKFQIKVESETEVREDNKIYNIQ